MGPIAKQEAICNQYPVAKEKLVSTSRVSLSNQVSEQALRPRQVDQHKTNLMLFVWTFLFHFAWFWHFLSLTDLLLACFIFMCAFVSWVFLFISSFLFFFEREKEHTVE